MTQELKSQEAYHICKYAKDNFKLKNIDKRYQITDSIWAYNYCRTIDNDPVVRQHIKDPLHIQMYLKHINPNDFEMKQRLEQHINSEIYF